MKCGVRDPFLVRHPQTGTVYLMATDLCIGAGKGWHREVCIAPLMFDEDGFMENSMTMEETDGCRVHILQGEGEISTIKPDPNTNLICTKTLIPVAVYHIKKGKNVLETEFCY